MRAGLGLWVWVEDASPWRVVVDNCRALTQSQTLSYPQDPPQDRQTRGLNSSGAQQQEYSTFSTCPLLLPVTDAILHG